MVALAGAREGLDLDRLLARRRDQRRLETLAAVARSFLQLQGVLLAFYEEWGPPDPECDMEASDDGECGGDDEPDSDDELGADDVMDCAAGLAAGLV